MKYKFLLDENIFYYAIKGVDPEGNPDSTCTELMRLISRNCHSIAIDRELAGRYVDHLSQLEEHRPRAMEPLWLFNELIWNSAKRSWESTRGITIPPEARIPPEDPISQG